MKTRIPILCLLAALLTGSDVRSATPLLILDRQSVAASDGVRFELAQAKKYSENPVLAPGNPDQWDGLQVAWPGTVLYEPESGIFRCWYSGLNAVQDRRPKKLRLPWETGYAESTDGIHWVKPNLRAPAGSGEVDCRILLPEDPVPLLNTVWANPDKSDPKRKFLCLWMEVNKETHRYNKILGSSPDGKSWRREKIAFQGSSTTWTSFQDICQVVYQPDEKDPQYAVLAYSQMARPRSWDGRTVRQIGFAHGPDVGSLVQDEDAVLVQPVKGIDEELHFASVRKFGDTYVMLFESDLFSLARPKTSFRLAVSQDGRHYRRVHAHHAVLSSGPVGSWDENVLVTTTSAMQTVGDEIWIFYFGTPGTFVRWPAQYAKSPNLRGSLFSDTWLGLAILPLDRLGCAVGPGQPHDFPHLHLRTCGPTSRSGSRVSGPSTPTAMSSPRERSRPSRSHTVYRKVNWSSSLPAGKYQGPGRLAPRTAAPPTASGPTARAPDFYFTKYSGYPSPAATTTGSASSERSPMMAFQASGPPARRRPGQPRANARKAAAISTRARCAPRQKWRPNPKPRWRSGFRPMSKRAGSVNWAGSRFAAPRSRTTI